jgi:hypothetical protein
MLNGYRAAPKKLPQAGFMADVGPIVLGPAPRVANVLDDFELAQRWLRLKRKFKSSALNKAVSGDRPWISGCSGRIRLRG